MRRISSITYLYFFYCFVSEFLFFIFAKIKSKLIRYRTHSPVYSMNIWCGHYRTIISTNLNEEHIEMCRVSQNTVFETQFILSAHVKRRKSNVQIVVICASSWKCCDFMAKLKNLFLLPRMSTHSVHTTAITAIALQWQYNFIVLCSTRIYSRIDNILQCDRQGYEMCHMPETKNQFDTFHKYVIISL